MGAEAMKRKKFSLRQSEKREGKLAFTEHLIRPGIYVYFIFSLLYFSCFSKADVLGGAPRC